MTARERTALVFAGLACCGCATTWESIPLTPTAVADADAVRLTMRGGEDVTMAGPVLVGDSIVGTSREEVCYPELDRPRSVCNILENRRAIHVDDVTQLERRTGNASRRVGVLGVAAAVVALLVVSVG